MTGIIESELAALEREEGITILWACEAGSRAWGLDSVESDYDVRFIYLRKTPAYLRASPLRDVIERPISDQLDFSGWDLPKALGLFRKSNPPLLEWLQSPIIYRCHEFFHQSITELLPTYVSPVNCLHHYLSMTQNNMRAHLSAETIRAKKYLAMLRPLLSALWIERGQGLPPLEFEKLLEQTIPAGELRSAIEKVVERKKNGDALEAEPQIPLIRDFIIEAVERFKAMNPAIASTQAWEPLDQLFRQVLIAVNGAEIESIRRS